MWGKIEVAEPKGSHVVSFNANFYIKYYLFYFIFKGSRCNSCNSLSTSSNLKCFIKKKFIYIIYLSLIKVLLV